MMARARQQFTFEEYLTLEGVSGVKHEFLDGCALAMARRTPRHDMLVTNVRTLLGEQLHDGRCRVLPAEARIRVTATGFATYPDVAVVCGEPEADPDDSSGGTTVNPSVIVEVPSGSTESFDRGQKLGQYKQIPTLQEVLHIAEEVPRIEHWRREGDHWTLEVRRAGEVATMASIGCEVPVSQVYRASQEGERLR